MERLASDPWIEWIEKAKSLNLADLDEKSPFDAQGHVRNLRSIWASHILFGTPIPEHLFQSPLRKLHPLIEALHLVLSKESNRPFPPLSHYNPILPLAQLCQFVLLKAIGGGEVKAFAQKILPFERFLSLWSPEKEYREDEAIWSMALLLRSFGTFISIPPNPSPFFIALAKQAPQWTKEGSFEEWGAQIHENGPLLGAFAMEGEEIPLGSLQAGEIQIPAFGPHAYPLNDPSRFGIRRTYSDRRWAATAALPEVWFEVAPDFKKGVIETRFFGLKREAPLAFAFYVKADLAEIGAEVFHPKSLHRYFGDAKKIVFTSKNSKLVIESECAKKMELIPLAGEGCFWNAQFLLAFEIPLIESRDTFKLSC